MISLSTKVRYATRILLYIAKNCTHGPVSTKKIAKGEELSFDYTEQILIILKGAGLVKSIRGVNGGFILAKSPDKISVADIINVIEGNIDIMPCIAENCPRRKKCNAHPLWDKANRALQSIFSEATLMSLLEKRKESQDSKQLFFDI